MSLILALSILFASQPAVPSELEHSVQAYWEALISGNPAGALPYIHPEDLNHFLKRQTPTFTDWVLKEIDLVEKHRARVTVSVKRLFVSGAQLPDDVHEVWEKSEGKWLLRVESSKELLKKRYTASEAASLPREVRILPKVLRFYQAAPGQPASLSIQNGLDSTVQVVKIELDDSLFEIRDSTSVTSVAPHSRARIFLDYTGKEEGDNLTSQLRLTLDAGEKIRTFEIPIIYNYIDDLSRWFMKQPGPSSPPRPDPEH